MKLNKFLYCLYVILVWPFTHIFCPCTVTGRENFPKGAAIVCSNHSSNFDAPVFATYIGLSRKVHFMSKAELLEMPVVGFLLKQAGVFPVYRGENTDIQAIRTAMGILKKGDKVMMFPQGTRVMQGEYVAAKTGAVRIAAKLGSPIVPVYITPGNKFLRHTDIVIGEPYTVERTANRDWEPAAEQLLEKINSLEPKH